MILTINGGSSSIKFSVASAGKKVLSGSIERIGISGTTLKSDAQEDRPIAAKDHGEAANELAKWLGEHSPGKIQAVGHRVVHGGLKLQEHQVVTDELVEELKQAQPLDLAHLPLEITLLEVFRSLFPDVPQVACFDTAFHRELPRVAHLLPIPRSYDRQGVRRFGFHGLSYAYLMGELVRLRSDAGSVILAHLGSGASMAAVRDGKPQDTSMAFTPTAGLVMGTRPGDMDPGLLVYLARIEKMSADQMDAFVNSRCGLLGVSETTSDMRDLLKCRKDDKRAREAVDLFCYQAKKTIGAYTAAMGGLETLVFSGGIGERSPEVRSQICAELGFLGISIDEDLNRANSGVISTGKVTVRVIQTDEETEIARIVSGFLD